MPRHVRKGDMVMVISGDGRRSNHPTGRVLRVLPGHNRVIVEGVNLHRKHVRRTQEQQQGGIIEKEMPVHISNVMPLADGKATRVRFERRPDGSKVRLAVRNGETIGPQLKKAIR